jgi:hypothetical protein
VCYDEDVSAREDDVKAVEPFDRAKVPMLIAAVGVALGLAVAGSVERTAGGAIVLGAWVLGIAALHRLGRAGSVARTAERADRGTPPAP